MLSADPGTGHSGGDWVLTGQLAGGGFLLLPYACKLFVTSVKGLGSGSSGGIFSPSLFMGATLGGAFAGAGVNDLARPANQRPGLRHGGYGHDGGKRHRRGRCPAVAMIFEMTRNYDIVLPMILAVAVGLVSVACCRAKTSTP